MLSVSSEKRPCKIVLLEEFPILITFVQTAAHENSVPHVGYRVCELLTFNLMLKLYITKLQPRFVPDTVPRVFW